MEPSLISEWSPAITNLSEEEAKIIQSNKTVENKIDTLRRDSKKSEEQIIEEFKQIEKEVDEEFKK